MLLNSFNTEYAEAPQSYRVRFAWVGQSAPNQYYTMHNWVVCRDFLGDHMYWLKTDHPEASIYSFGLTNKSAETDLMAIKFPKTVNRDLFIKQIEKLNMTEMFNVVGTIRSGVIIKLKPEHMKTIWQISFITFLAKIVSFVEKDSLEELLVNAPATEQQYTLTVGNEKIIKLYQNMHNFLFGDSMVLKDGDTYAIHNNNGFVSVFGPKYPNFYKNQLEAF